MDSSGFQAGLGAAERDLRTFQARAQTASRQAVTAFRNVGDSWRTMTGALSVVGISGAAISLAGLTRTAGEFERQMINLRHISQGTTEQMGVTTDLVRRLGLEWGVGARAAGGAARELIKVGATIEDLNEGALESVIVLARAQGASYEEAASIAGRAMTVFDVDASRMAEIVQGVNATVNAGAFELSDYALALQQGGAAARDAGLDLDDFNATLAVLQRALGSTGSDTGTSLRVFLNFIVPKSEEAARAMERLKLSFFDHGAFVGIEEAAQRLHDTFSRLTDRDRREALRDILGMDAMRAGIALINNGAEGVARWREEIANGADVIDQARGYTEGWMGAVDNLSAAFEDLGIAIAESGLLEALAGVARGIAGTVRSATTGVEAWSDEGLAAIGGGAALEALQREGRRQSGRWFASPNDALKEAVERMGAQGVIDYLRETPERRYGTEETGRSLAETRAGERIVQMMLRAQAEALARQAPPSEADQFWLNRHDPEFWRGWQADQERQERERNRYTRQAGGSQRETFPALLGGDETIEDLMKELQDELVRAGVEDALEISATIELDRFQIDQLKLEEAAENFTGRIYDALERAWVDLDFSSIGQEIDRAWRQALWDAFVGDDMRSFMKDLAGEVKKLLNWSLGGNTSLFGALGSLFGFGGSSAGGSSGLMARGPGQPADPFAFTPPPNVLGGVFGLGSIFGGMFAEGGYLKPGEWGIAGERGPEPIFGGKTGMTIIPAGEGIAPRPVINLTFHTDARGADQAAVARIEAGQRAIAENFETLVVAAVNNGLERRTIGR